MNNNNNPLFPLNRFLISQSSLNDSNNPFVPQNNRMILEDRVFIRNLRINQNREQMKLKLKKRRHFTKYKCEHVKQITEVILLLLFFVRFEQLTLINIIIGTIGVKDTSEFVRSDLDTVLCIVSDARYQVSILQSD